MGYREILAIRTRDLNPAPTSSSLLSRGCSSKHILPDLSGGQHPPTRQCLSGLLHCMAYRYLRDDCSCLRAPGQTAATKKCPRLHAKYPTAPKKTQGDKFRMCRHTGREQQPQRKRSVAVMQEEEAGSRWGECPNLVTTAPHSSLCSKENPELMSAQIQVNVRGKKTLWKLMFQRQHFKRESWKTRYLTTQMQLSGFHQTNSK